MTLLTNVIHHNPEPRQPAEDEAPERVLALAGTPLSPQASDRSPPKSQICTGRFLGLLPAMTLNP